MTKSAKTPVPSDRVRPVGDPHDRTFEIPLSAEDIDRLHRSLLDQMDLREEIRDKLAEMKKLYASQLETNEAAIDTIRRQIRQGKERRTVEVQNYLTRSNEVITVSVLTGQVIGDPRTATIDELQEELPLSSVSTDDLPAFDA